MSPLILMNSSSNNRNANAMISNAIAHGNSLVSLTGFSSYSLLCVPIASLALIFDSCSFTRLTATSLSSNLYMPASSSTSAAFLIFLVGVSMILALKTFAQNDIPYIYG